MASREVVEADDLLIERQQGLYQVRADEAGRARHQPAARRSRKLFTNLVVARHRNQRRIRCSGQERVTARGRV